LPPVPQGGPGEKKSTYKGQHAPFCNNELFTESSVVSEILNKFKGA
jgi:hypothetical protein